MIKNLFCLLVCACFGLKVFAQTDIVMRGDTLLLPNGLKFWLGEQVTLNSGSLPDRGFNYIYEPEKLRIVKKKPLSGSYSGQTATISKFQRDGAYKGGYSYNIIVLDFGRRRTFWCDVQGALNSNEIINTYVSDHKNTANNPGPATDKATRLARLKQLLDSGQITKEEYETLKNKLENEKAPAADHKPIKQKKPAKNSPVVF